MNSNQPYFDFNKANCLVINSNYLLYNEYFKIKYHMYDTMYISLWKEIYGKRLVPDTNSVIVYRRTKTIFKMVRMTNNC